MNPLIMATRNKWSLKDVLNGSNKTLNDLPVLNKYVVNGKNTLCYKRVLGFCNRGMKCYNKGGHEVEKLWVPDGFANDICTAIRPGVQWALSQAQAGVPPGFSEGAGDKRKRGGGTG